MNDLSHNGLVDSLAEQFRDVQHRLVFTGVGLGSRWLQGGSVPTPDVFTIQKSYTKPAMSIYECKAAVADFRHEITSGKWAKYRPYCNRFYFATPSGLVGKADIPEGCGWITLGAKGWSVRISPVYNPDAELDDWEWMSLLFSIRAEKNLIRNLEDRARAAANLRFFNPAHDKVTQALNAAQRACTLSRQEQREYINLSDEIARLLGLDGGALRKSPWIVRDHIRKISEPIGPRLEKIADSLVKLAEEEAEVIAGAATNAD